MERAGWLFLLLSTGAILIAYLNMKFVGLGEDGTCWVGKTLNTNSDTSDWTGTDGDGLVRRLCRKEICSVF